MAMKHDQIRCAVIPGNKISCCDNKSCKSYKTLKLKSISLQAEKNIIKGIHDTGENHSCIVIPGDRIKCTSDWGDHKTVTSKIILLPGHAWIG